MNYFVCNSKGDDSNKGYLDSPFKTIHAASQIAGRGDIINFQ